MPNPELTIFLPNEAATQDYAQQFARAINDQVVVFLQGPLGAGKTTFCRGILRCLGYVGSVRSPTYTLVESYDCDQFSVFHFDLYRIHDPSELEFIGIRDYLAENAIFLVEWPELGIGWLPEPDITCYFMLEAEGRKLKIVANSLTGEKILKKMQSE